ncbi:ABC transporter ATP-binding protein [Candidatus Woesearchaeota archaeon]|nr:ABC transporter ATP-binding protein [Candidatus Woesearchaeota archaeon]
MEYALTVKGVTKKFRDKGRDFYALKDISFNIKKGEVFGLLGPNGAGKTTLMNSIVGIVLPDEGEITILGMKNSNRELFDRINSISAETYFHWGLKPRDILRFYAKVYGIDKNTAEKRIEELIRIFEIKEILINIFGRLSTGERMRMAFAKAMINEPELLLLDEPTLGLDPHIAQKTRNLIKSINKHEKTTILLTSHYMQEVELLAQRVAFINKGKIVDTGKISKVKLKHFNTYDLWVKPVTLPARNIIRELGFELKERSLYREMETKEDLSVILSQLHKSGVEIKDVKVRRPTLEDYFIKLTQRDAEKDR